MPNRWLIRPVGTFQTLSVAEKGYYSHENQGFYRQNRIARVGLMDIVGVSGYQIAQEIMTGTQSVRKGHRLCENYFRKIKVENRNQFMAVIGR